jgi:2-amino-4-hydroxy-6-hydroxymethyldihydropteridine diphosphokinase
MQHDFVIGLGSNLGDRASFLARGTTDIAALDGVQLTSLSRVFETEPVGPPQPRYLNAAIRVATERTPERLLEQLLQIEQAVGRTRDVRWGPRVLDLDILWSDEPHNSERLTVPHAHLCERTFALAPLLDVAPELAADYAHMLTRLGGPPSVVARLFFDARRRTCEYVVTDGV